MLAELEERDVPAPRVPADDGTLRVGDPARDEIREPCVHVLELRPADVPDERVAPLAAVADRAAVVDHPDGEAGVDVRLHLRLPAVEVEPGRSAVDEHQHRERASRVVRRDEEAVHALPVWVLEVPRLVRPRRRRALAERDDLGARVVEDEPLPLALLVERTTRARPVGHAPSRCSRARSRSGVSSPSRRRSGRGTTGPRAMFASRSAEPSGHQSAAETSPSRSSRSRSKSPVSRFQIAGPRVAVALVVARETLIAGHGRPAASGERHPLVELLADRFARARVDDAERWVDEVAVLGVLEAEQRAVRGERPAEKSPRLDAPEPHRVIGAVDRLCRAAVDRHVDGEALAIGDRRDDDPRCLREPFVPAVRHAVEEQRRLASVERLHVPAAGLVAALVLEPENAVAVERRDGVDETDGMVGHLPARAGLGVERVDLPDARLVRDVDGVYAERPATTPGDTRRERESAVPMRAGSCGRGSRRTA